AGVGRPVEQRLVNALDKNLIGTGAKLELWLEGANGHVRNGGGALETPFVKLWGAIGDAPADGGAARPQGLGQDDLAVAGEACERTAVVLEQTELRVPGQRTRGEAGAPSQGADEVAAIVRDSDPGSGEDVRAGAGRGIQGDESVLEAD